MGMFDYIKTPDIRCPTCGEKVIEFQSKDAQCNMDTIDFWQVDYFYSSCDNCKTWVSFSLTKERPYRPLSDYHMDAKTRENKK